MQTLLSQVLQVSFVFCFRYMKAFVLLAITFMLHLVVYLAQTVLWTRRRPPAASQVRTMHHSYWRPGLPSGAAGTLLALFHFWILSCCGWSCWFKMSFSSTGTPVELYSALPVVAAEITPVSQLQRWRQWQWRGGGRIPVWASDDLW